MKNERLSQLLELTNIDKLIEYVIEYAEHHPEFEADLMAHLEKRYVDNEEHKSETDWREEVDWALSQTTYIGDRWHDDEVPDWEEIFECIDRIFDKADILLEVGNAEAALTIGIQFFISMDKVCRETDYYEEDFYDPSFYIEHAKELIVKSIGAYSVSSVARQEAFATIRKLAEHCSIEYYDLNFNRLLTDMSIVCSTDEEALKLLDEELGKRDNHKYVTMKAEILHRLNHHEEADAIMQKYLHLPEIRMAKLNRALAEKRYDDALQLAEDGYVGAKQKSKLGYGETIWLHKLLEVYCLQGNRQGEISTHRRLFIIECGSLNHYHELKKLVPSEEWSDFLSSMMAETHFPLSFFDHQAKCEIYLEEGDKASLFNYLSSIDFNRLEALHMYAHHLADDYSDELIGMYVADLREFAAMKMGRGNYQKMANYMREMQKLTGGRESATRLAHELSTKYCNRRAMKDELKEFIP